MIEGQELIHLFSVEFQPTKAVLAVIYECIFHLSVWYNFAILFLLKLPADHSLINTMLG
jgi:hypothetical protein